MRRAPRAGLRAPGSAYGAAGSLAIVVMWVYYSSLILLFGAVSTGAAVRERAGGIRPRDIAVLVWTEAVEEEFFNRFLVE